ncbi:NAD(P)/FAD-dependent oxidoreductase [Pseudalkalibacillus decolorationis]|uniref:NAD(P)/FAD-dependent oxidoreductase n=1 Tax=Pseudalkalibacillus decolorationis TaxID=163879 RepID=UPI0021488055|nr:FAD/NAD(P)-binding oxidoreductase [Pseudalkalibacillus decolorationis]
MNSLNHHQVLVVGGGTAGITVAAHLSKLASGIDIAIVEPSSKHYYQPLWTLVGGGVFQREESEKEEKDVIPEHVEWYQDAVKTFYPEQNYVLTEDGKEIHYKYLVVAPGLQLNWNQIKGLDTNLGKYGICSNYSYNHVEYSWETISNFKEGNAIFTYPNSPVKCGGAPQKIMYLAEESFRNNGVRDKANVTFVSPNDSIFSVEKYARTLEGIIEERNINTMFNYELTEIMADRKLAVFINVTTDEYKTLPFELLHVVPPMSAPDFIRESPLSDEAGWVDVDAYSLQHNKYPNIFSLGDASSLPTSKTGAAIRKQAPVVVSNLYNLIKKRPMRQKYDGYTSCPLVTGYGKLVLAEFVYGNKPKETFPFNQAKERKSMYWLKKYGLPAMYWNGMLKGRA